MTGGVTDGLSRKRRLNDKRKIRKEVLPMDSTCGG